MYNAFHILWALHNNDFYKHMTVVTWRGVSREKKKTIVTMTFLKTSEVYIVLSFVMESACMFKSIL